MRNQSFLAHICKSVQNFAKIHGELISLLKKHKCLDLKDFNCVPAPFSFSGVRFADVIVMMLDTLHKF